MKIAINGLSATVGGGVTYLKNLVPELGRVSDQHSYVVFLRDRVAASWSSRLPSNVMLVPVPISGLLHRVAFEQAKLPRLLRALNADLVFGVAEIAPLGAPCKVIIACRNPNLYTEQQIAWPARTRAQWAVLRHLARLSARRASLVISVSKSWRQRVAEALGVPEDRVVAIPHGVSETFRSVGGAALHASHAGRAADAPWLSVSTIYRYKNYVTLVRALGVLRDRTGATRPLLIVGGCGDRPYERMMRAEIQRQGLEDQVRLVGAVPHPAVRDLYASAFGMVFPSYLETFGHPLLEALAAALPTAASDTPVFREIAGDCVSYFDPFSERDIATKMAELAADPERRAEMARGGFERSSLFSWARTADLTVRAFERAVA